MSRKRSSLFLYTLLFALLIMLIGCQSTDTESVEEVVEPLATEVADVIEEVVEPTPVPPTATPLPPTATPVPPTATPEPPTPTPEPDPNVALAEALQGIVDKWAADERFPSAMLLVDAPTMDLYWKGAAGVRDLESGEPVSPDDAIAIASVTKSMTAATILRLEEEGLLTLDDLVADYLDADLVDRLNVIDGVSYGPEITIRQLLNHTSGIVDYGFVDNDENGVGDFYEELLANPDQAYTPMDAIEWGLANSQPIGPPGGQWVYTSAGYQLLGMIAEEASGQEITGLYNTYLFEPLEMEHTWINAYSDPMDADVQIAHPYANNVDVYQMPSHEYGWAAGGGYSTLDDQADFWRALLAENTLFEDPDTLAEMKTWVEAIPGAAGYGLGLIRYDLEPLGMDGLPSVIGHAGIHNTMAYYWPEMDAIIVLTLNSDTDFRSYFPFMAEVMYTMQGFAAES